MTRFFCAFAILLGVCAPLVPASAGTLAPDLEQVLAEAGSEGLVPVVVLMDEFPDQAALLAEVRGLNRDDRRARVVSRMRTLAQRSQASVRGVLAGEAGRVTDVRVLWGINGIAMHATPDIVERIAVLPGVRFVLHDREIPLEEAVDVDLERLRAEYPPYPGRSEGPFPMHDGRGDGPTGGDESGPNPTADVAGEVIAMGAKRVWDELGYTGAGVIVAVLDTGVDRNHPDLADHMWTNLDEVAGNGTDDDANGFVDDTWGWDFCGDDNEPTGGSHGTQAAGQVAGDGTNGTVTGMAPDAEIMAVGMSCGGPSSWFAASDYAIENGAHMISMSFSEKWPSDPDYAGHRRQSDTELAAGIIRINSTGNTGTSSDPVPYNIATPGNVPPPWLHPDQTVVGGVSSTIGTANISYTTDDIDASSPYGPAAWEDIRANTDPGYPHVMPAEYQDYPYENGGSLGLLKPDLAAYGAGTTSICPGTGYCGFGGTSSATPHIAGVAALMLSSNIQATPEAIAQALLTNAQPRGVPGKDNRYGAGLVQAYESVIAVESALVYDTHTIDDVAGGNGNATVDPGERVTMAVDLRNTRDDATYNDAEGVLTTTTPGVTIHNHHASWPGIAPGVRATSESPHYSFTVDPSACGATIVFDLELRFGGKVRNTIIRIRVGQEASGDLLYDDFESDLGWTSDTGTADEGQWVREDPIGVTDGSSEPTNPEDDTSDPGTTCWVTGNGSQSGKQGENNNDVDGGQVILLSPPIDAGTAEYLELSYDRWYYDNSSGSDRFFAEVSNDGGANWTEIERLLNSSGGWGRTLVNLTALATPTDDMRIRFVVLDGAEDTAVEGAVDEVRVWGRYLVCTGYTPPAAQAPNGVTDTVHLDADAAGHVVLTWSAPTVDAGHDAATLYRIERATSPAGPFAEVGSATSTRWVDVDAMQSTESRYYRVRAENEGGSE